MKGILARQWSRIKIYVMKWKQHGNSNILLTELVLSCGCEAAVSAEQDIGGFSLGSAVSWCIANFL